MQLHQPAAPCPDLASPWCPQDLAWAAGLFEGEGWITERTYQSPKQLRTLYYPQLGLHMTDPDIVHRFHDVVRLGMVSPARPLAGRKPLTLWRLANFQDVQALIAAFWPWLGERRRRRALEVLSKAALGKGRAA